MSNFIKSQLADLGASLLRLDVSNVMNTSKDNSKEQPVLFNLTDTTHQNSARCLQQQYFRYWRQLLSMVGLKTTFWPVGSFWDNFQNFWFHYDGSPTGQLFGANHITQQYSGRLIWIKHKF